MPPKIRLPRLRGRRIFQLAWRIPEGVRATLRRWSGPPPKSRCPIRYSTGKIKGRVKGLPTHVAKTAMILFPWKSMERATARTI